MDVIKIGQVILEYREYIELVLAIFFMLNSSARGAIATVAEILQKANLTNEEALQKASDLMGKSFPFIPDLVRKWIIQSLFNSMKKASSTAK
jgi:hypothetical protein